MKQAYDNKKSVKDFSVGVGQIVYIENVSRSQKFDKLYLGPYIVKSVDETNGSVKVENALTGTELQRSVSFAHLKVIKVRSVSELFDVPVEEEYEVAAILDHRVKKGKLEYLVLWRNYPEPTWNFAEDMTNCQEIIDDYNQNSFEI
eukprot:Nk52_evm1s1241 gene=Nk52_evmTU1s1241